MRPRRFHKLAVVGLIVGLGVAGVACSASSQSDVACSQGHPTPTASWQWQAGSLIVHRDYSAQARCLMIWVQGAGPENSIVLTGTARGANGPLTLEKVPAIYGSNPYGEAGTAWLNDRDTSIGADVYSFGAAGGVTIRVPEY